MIRSPMILAALIWANVGIYFLQPVELITNESMTSIRGGQEYYRCRVGYQGCCASGVACAVGLSSGIPCTVSGAPACSFATNTTGKSDLCLQGSPANCDKKGDWDDPYGCGYRNNCLITKEGLCNCNNCTLDSGWPCTACKACNLL
jgi:hypothetical protein